MDEKPQQDQLDDQHVTSELIRLVCDLTESNANLTESRALARYLGAEELIIFLSDDRNSAPVPLPGWQATLPGGEEWNQLLAETPRAGFMQAHVPYPTDDRLVPVTGIAHDHVLILVLIGIHASVYASKMQSLRLLLPLLATAMHSKQGSQEAASDRSSYNGATIEKARLEQESEEAGQAREAFITIVSHELRTPLTTVRGYIQILYRLLQDPDLDRERLVRAVQQLDNQTNRIEELVSDMLDISRIRQGKLELERGPMDLRDSARRVIARFAATREMNIQHRIWLDAPEPAIGNWDAFRLEQVLSNLISNALKYSPHGGDIRIAIQCNDEIVELTVHDNGLGISSEGQSRLFEPFYRDPNMKVRIGGTGLGLFISQGIIERHGGSLEVESQEDVGSTFTVRLPRERV